MCEIKKEGYFSDSVSVAWIDAFFYRERMNSIIVDKNGKMAKAKRER